MEAALLVFKELIAFEALFTFLRLLNFMSVSHRVGPLLRVFQQLFQDCIAVFMLLFIIICSFSLSSVLLFEPLEVVDSCIEDGTCVDYFGDFLTTIKTHCKVIQM